MKRNDAQKFKVLLFILACLVPVLVYAAMFGANNFNWFSIPQPHELYLESYDTQASHYVNFAAHSSRTSQCTMLYCWTTKNVTLNEGLNYFREPIDNCNESFRVYLECSTSTVSFRCNKSISESSYNSTIVSTAGNSAGGGYVQYPVSMLAVLLLSLASALLLAVRSKMDLLPSLLLIFAVSSSTLVLQFHLTSLGINEWTIPLACAVILVLAWKKMQ